MKQGLWVLLLGLALGTGSYMAYMHCHQPFDARSLDGQLAWMKTELHLSDEQFSKIRELHQSSSPRLRALALQISRMQEEFNAFETTRKQSDRVDFVEFARFVEARREVSRECQDSTHALVLAAAGQMTPAQRKQYFSLLSSLPAGGGSAN